MKKLNQKQIKEVREMLLTFLYEHKNNPDLVLMGLGLIFEFEKRYSNSKIKISKEKCQEAIDNIEENWGKLDFSL